VTGLLVPDAEEELAIEGGTLHLEHFRPLGPPAGLVVLVHGFDAHCGLYRHVGAALAAHGFAATSFDGRGHGKSSGRRGHVDRFALYGRDLDAVLAAARARVPGVPVTAMGHSQGGLVVLDAVLRGALTPAPDRLVLAAPWLGLAMPVPWWKRAASPLFARIWPTLSLDNGLRAVDISRNPALARTREEDPLIHHLASARWFEEVRQTQGRIQARSAPLPIPTLVLVAGQDRIVSTEATLAFVRSAGPAVAVRRYDEAYHDLFIEPEQDQVIADVVAWLRAPVTTGLDLGRASLAVPGII
jgi:alpha-beta hydrolase superfamily lysophospholipase